MQQRAEAKQHQDPSRLMNKIKQVAVGSICVVATQGSQPKVLDGTPKNTVVGHVGIVLGVESNTSTEHQCQNLVIVIGGRVIVVLPGGLVEGGNDKRALLLQFRQVEVQEGVKPVSRGGGLMHVGRIRHGVVAVVQHVWDIVRVGGQLAGHDVVGELLCGVVDLGAALIFGGVGAEEQGGDAQTTVDLRRPLGVGAVDRSIKDVVIAVEGPALGSGWAVPFDVHGVVDAPDVEEIVDGGCIDVVEVLGVHAEEITREKSSVVGQGRMGDAVGVGQ